LEVVGVKGIGRIAAGVALVALLLPWFHVEVGVNFGHYFGLNVGLKVVEKDYSLLDVLISISNHGEGMKNFFSLLDHLGRYTYIAEDIKTLASLLLLAIFLIPVGAVLSLLTGGKLGHVIGIGGMALLTYVLNPLVGQSEGMITYSTGYYTAWVAFLAGVVLGGSTFEHRGVKVDNSSKSQSVSSGGSLTAGQKAFLAYLLLPWWIIPMASIGAHNPVGLVASLMYSVFLTKGAYDAFTKGAIEGFKWVAIGLVSGLFLGLLLWI
jgi:hypothetical protein